MFNVLTVLSNEESGLCAELIGKDSTRQAKISWFSDLKFYFYSRVLIF